MRIDNSVAGALLIVLCGCSTDPAQDWFGVWNPIGTLAVSSSDASTSSPLSGGVLITAGPVSGTFEASTTCGLAWDVSGAGDDSATLDPPEVTAVAATSPTCSLDINGSSLGVAFTEGTATLTGNTMAMSLKGVASNGDAITEAANLTRVNTPPPIPIATEPPSFQRR